MAIPLARSPLLGVYLLLLFTLCLSPTEKPTGVDSFSPPLPSHVCTRKMVIEKYSTSSRLWMTAVNSADGSISDDHDHGDDVNLPKLKMKLTREFFSIGFPAFIQLAAEPLAALVVCREFTITSTLKYTVLLNQLLLFIAVFVPNFYHRIRLTSVRLLRSTEVIFRRLKGGLF